MRLRFVANRDDGDRKLVRVFRQSCLKNLLLQIYLPRPADFDKPMPTRSSPKYGFGAVEALGFDCPWPVFCFRHREVDDR